MQVVNLRSCADMLKVWTEIRSQILRGEVEALAVTARSNTGQELILFAGEYSSSRHEAARAVMRLSWELTKEEDHQDFRESMA